tara:strand:+ start:184 stop:900 length:717 start_codon:yes stop_codon:yes gene_type:complete
MSKDFKINNIVFDDKIKSLDTGAKMKMVSYNRNPIIIQTPECYLPYGINNNNMDDETVFRYTMDVSFKDKESRPGLMKFFKVIESFDQLIIEQAFKNHKDWFKKSFPSKEVVEALYTPMIKYAKDKETGEITDAYPPTFKFKIPYSNEKLQVEFFDYQAAPMDGLELVKMNTKGAKAISIIKCNGLWFAGGKFGVSWKAIQVQISPKINTVNGCAIQFVSEDSLNNESGDDNSSDDEL